VIVGTSLAPAIRGESLALLTDIRPIVERLLQKLVLAGLPLVAACDDTTRVLGGSAGKGDAGSGGVIDTGGFTGTGSSGTGGFIGTGGSGTGGFIGTGGIGTGGDGFPGDAGVVACVPFSALCGVPSTVCPPPVLDGSAGSAPPIVNRTIDFVPDDPRWGDFYRACIAAGGGCNPDCRTICAAAPGALAGGAYFSCKLTCGEPNRLSVDYQLGVCAAELPTEAGLPAPARAHALLGEAWAAVWMPSFN
jgi:hypothetical protein